MKWVSLLLQASLSRLPSADTAGSKPNIIFVLFDDPGYGQTKCHREGTKFNTPNIDRLAKERLVSRTLMCPFAADVWPGGSANGMSACWRGFSNIYISHENADAWIGGQLKKPPLEPESGQERQVLEFAWLRGGKVVDLGEISHRENA